jgi:immune inhibitor A
MKSGWSLVRAASQIILTVCVLLAFLKPTQASAPTEEAIAQWKADGSYEQKMETWRQHRIANGYDLSVWTPETARRTMAAISNDANDIDTLRLCVILVEFPDYPASSGSVSVSRAQFDSLLFSDKLIGGVINPTGSMTDYYRENSYGKLYITGEVFGWYMMSQPLSYYVGSDNGLSEGPILAAEAALAANNDIDFRNFRSPDGLLHGLVIVHAGPGAEGGANNIWSHRGNIQSALQPDSVSIMDYIMNPEENPGGGMSAIGVFCHEYGHTLGLPDFYDVAYNPGSNGLGNWALMAAGNYNGQSRVPAHMCAFSKWSLGYLHADTLSTNLAQITIPPLSTDSTAFALVPGGGAVNGPQYWIVENRQPYGFDAELPGHGLLIYHVDLNQFNQTDPSNYRLAIEQADGLDQLAFGGSRGDAADPWPGTTNNRNFHTYTTPNSLYYDGTESEIAVWNISDSDSLMTADFDIEYSRPLLDFYGNDSLTFVDAAPDGDADGFLEAGETIAFNLHIQNLMKPAAGGVVHLSCDVPGIQFIVNDQLLTSQLQPNFRPKLVSPITFTMPQQFDETFGNFLIEFTIDSTDNAPGSGEYYYSIPIRIPLGTPEVLIVDDDGGQSAQVIYEEAMSQMGIGYQTWSIQAKGTPSAADLADYKHIFWSNGYPNGGEISYFSRQSLISYLDAGGNLCLTTLVTDTLMHYDSVFLMDYMHVREVGHQQTIHYVGISGSQLGNGVTFEPVVQPYVAQYATLTPYNGGEAAIKGNFGGSGTFGVTYAGTFRSVFLTFPLEMVTNSPTSTSYAPRDTLFARIMEFFGRIPTDVGDDDRSGLPTEFSLAPNYPNPFNPTTTISYTINRTPDGTAPKRIKLEVFNTLGQRVKTLVNKTQPPGTYVVEWDGTNGGGVKVASGIYFYRLSRDNAATSRKMMLIK